MMAALPEPTLLDVTFRDGSFQVHHSLTLETAASLAEHLFAAGIRNAEFGHGCGIGAKLLGQPAKADDEEFLEAAKKAAPELKLSAIIPATDLAVALLPALIDFLDTGRVLGDVLQPATAQKAVQKLKKYGKTVCIQLVRSHRFTPEQLSEAARDFETMGADVIYLVDSFGSMLPDEVTTYAQSLRSSIKVEVGFHGHNHIGMAVPNTMAAWKAGATWLDASLLGVGRDGGNTQLEALAVLLQTEGKGEGLQLEKLCQATQEVILPVFEHAPASRFIDLLLSEFRLDYDNKEFLILLANGLHIPLRRFISALAEKRGDGILLMDEHIRGVVTDFGHNFEEFDEAFKKKS